jgi:hypothetical protein
MVSVLEAQRVQAPRSLALDTRISSVEGDVILCLLLSLSRHKQFHLAGVLTLFVVKSFDGEFLGIEWNQHIPVVLKLDILSWHLLHS